MSIERRDSVPISAGVANLPQEFRDVAKAANLAGLQGWKYVDADYGVEAEGEPVLAIYYRRIRENAEEKKP